jgi:methyl-accepting chemotaxis protein
MTLQTQLRLIAAITLFSLIGVIVFAVIQLQHMRSDFVSYQDSQAFTRDLAEIKSAALTVSRADPILLETVSQLADTDVRVSRALRELVAMKLPGTDIELVKRIEGRWQEYVKGLGQAVKIAETSPEDALQMPDVLYSSKLQPMIADLDQLAEANRASRVLAEASIAQSIGRILWLVVLPLVFAGIIIVVFQAVFNRRLNERVEEILGAMNHLIDGNLTYRLSASYRDEFGTVASTINSLIARFETILGDVNASAGQTLQTSDRVSQMTRTVSRNAQLQSEKVNNVSASILEMHRTATEIAEHAEQAAVTAAQTRRQVREGAVIGQETITMLSRLDATMGASTQTMDGLSQALRQIDSISNIIKGIAEQTTLLALNAAIEAARAGEYGRGFAVVADEVRVLSDRTTQSAKDISTLLAAVQRSACEAVEAMRMARGEVQASVGHGERIGNVLGEIEVSMQSVAEMMQQIAQSTQAQSSASDLITQDIQAVSSATQATASDIETARHQMADLAEASNNLHGTISKFRFNRTAGNDACELFA